MRYLKIGVAVLAMVFGCAAFGFGSSEHVGIVKSLVGEALIVRGEQEFNAVTHAKLKQGDLIKTGLNGKIGLVFEDDTVVSLGPNSQILIEDFLFEPAINQLSFIARIIQGTASFLSGQIAKLAPEMVRVETPDATIGMRGTHVLIKVDPH
jgi:hypothetical protein